MNELDWTLSLWHLIEEHYDESVIVGRERRLFDRTRVDILTQSWAIEVDWAPKWAEAIGQALYYANMTYRQPGVVLLLKDWDKEQKFVYRTKIAQSSMHIWLVDTEKSVVHDFDNKTFKLG